MLRLVVKVCHKGAEVFGWWGVVALWALTGLVTLAVVMRYALGAPLYLTEELSALLLMTLFFLAMPYTFIKGGHVRITVLTSRLPSKVEGWTEVVAHLVTLVFLIFFLKLTSEYVYVSYQLGCRTINASLYEVPWLATMVIGPLLFAIVVGISAVQKARSLIP